MAARGSQAALLWTRQPNVPARIARTPLTVGLVDAVIPKGNLGAVSAGSTGGPWFTPTASPTVAVNNQWGLGPTFNGTSQFMSRNAVPYPLNQSISSLKELSMMVLCIPSTVATATTSIFGYGNSGSANPIAFIGQGTTGSNISFRVRDTANTNVEVQSGTSALWANGVPALLIATRSESANVTRIFANGTQLTSTTAGATSTVSFDRTAIGALRRNTDGLFWPGSVFLAVSWTRALTPAEVASLSANPWQIFEFRRFSRKGTTAGSTITGAGSSTGTSTVAGVSAATAAEVGSSTGTSTVSGIGLSTNAQVGNSDGTSTVAATGAATAASVGNADGTSTATAASAVTLSGVGNAAGTSTATAVSQGAHHTVGGYPGGFHAFSDKRRKQQKQQADDLALLLKRLMGLLPKDAPEPIVEAKAEAVAAVAKVEADTSEQDLADLQRATLLVAKLESLLRAYEARNDEDDEDLLLLSQ